MRRDERVVEEHCNDQLPSGVASEFRKAAGALADTLASLDDGAWSRTGMYNYSERRIRTVEWIGLHTVHEAEHHLRDIDRVSGSPTFTRDSPRPPSPTRRCAPARRTSAELRKAPHHAALVVRWARTA